MSMSVIHGSWVTGRWGILELHLSLTSTLLRLWGISGAPTGAGQEAVILYPPQSTLETPWAVTFSIPLAFELL